MGATIAVSNAIKLLIDYNNEQIIVEYFHTSNVRILTAGSILFSKKVFSKCEEQDFFIIYIL